MKQKLSGLDRLNIPMILERATIEGNESEMITLKAVKTDLLKKVGLNNEAIAHYDIRPAPNGGVIWNAARMAVEKPYDLTDPEIALLKQAGEALDKSRRITEQLLDTCLKIKEIKLPEDNKPEK